jgi:hypothetical protein
MSKLIRSLIFVAIILSPGFIIYYGLQFAFAPSHEEQFAKALTADCKAEFERIQTASMNKYGVRFYGTPDYCYDHARNKKHYGYTN